MKNIKKPRHLSIDFSTFRKNNDNISDDAIDELDLVFRENRVSVIEFINYLEKQFDEIITYYFWGNIILKSQKRDEFNELILSKSWCNFSSKKSVIVKILEKENFLTDKQKKSFLRSLNKLLETRNLFAHGHVTLETKSTVRISYSGRTFDAVSIDEAYLENIENCIEICSTTTRLISDKLNVGYYEQQL